MSDADLAPVAGNVASRVKKSERGASHDTPPRAPSIDRTKIGDLIDACAISLPKNDVVEAIEFERFFVLNLQFAEFQRPATLMSAWASQSSEISEEHLASLEPMLSRGAPFSAKRADWEASMGSQQRNVSADTRSKKARMNQTAGNTALNISDYQLAFYLPYIQEWRLLGYSRGRMVSSLTLGPLEEQTIEIFKWDRISHTLDSTTTFEMEQSNETSGTRRDTTDVARDISRQAGFELTSDAKVGFKVEVVNVDISAGMSAKTSLSDAEKDTRQSIIEATARATTRVRSSRTLKVLETQEYGQETRITRKLRNNNTCHTLTTAFFEILANYTVSTYLRTDAVRLVVLLKSGDLSRITNFDRRMVRSHERALRLASLDSTLAAGFDAARYLDARDRACAILCAGCDCGMDTGVAAGAEWEALVQALKKLGMAVTALRAYVVLFPLSVAIALAEAPVGPGVGAKDIKRHMFMQALGAHAPRLLTDLGGLALDSMTPTAATAESTMTIINGVAADALAALGYDKGISDGEWWKIYIVILPLTPADPLTQGIVTAITTGALIGAIGGLSTYDDNGLLAAMADVKAKYEAWQADLKARRAADEKLAQMEKIAKEERALRVLEAYPLRETADAQERLEALLDHLNDQRNIDHYRFAVWNERAGSTDPQLLALALAGFTEGAPVGVVGDDLAVPIRLPQGSTIESFFNNSMEDLEKLAPRDDRDHILPTSALYAEAIPGVCCACEKNAVRAEELDLARKQLENSLKQLEADRLSARLKADQLDEPAAAAPIRVEVINTTPLANP